MNVIEQFEKKGIVGLTEGIAQQKTLCPNCSHHRKKSDEPCLSCNLETGAYHCFNCGYAGGVAGGAKIVQEHYSKKDYTIPNYNPEEWELSEEVIKYFEGRGISQETLVQNKVGSRFGKLNGKKKAEPVISFPYIKDKIVNVKYRTLEKEFQFTKGAETCMYGMQNLFEDGQLATSKVFIVEGEIDALTLYEAGFRYALSVPTGASFEEEGQPRTTPKLVFLEDPDLISILSHVDEIVICTDSDYKGQRLREELSQRLGIEKCFTVTYPEGCKDFNDVMQKYGRDTVIETVLDYSPMMKGVVTVSSMKEALLQYYEEGTEGGMICGIDGLDDIFTTQHSQLIIVTGTPESMKSVCMDNITSGLALNYDIHSCMYSPESRPMEMHIARLASIHNGYRLGTPDEEDRMPYQDYVESCDWVGKHYSFIQPPTNSLEEILQLWKISMAQHGSKVFVLDPYSKVNWDGENEHQFIRRMLNELGEFASRNRVTVFVVAHPRKMELKKAKGDELPDYKIVQPYDIAGSSSFYNSADIILSLWRSKNQEDSPLKIYVQKSKLHHIAQSGKSCELEYNFDNWRLGNRQYDIEIEDLTGEESYATVAGK
jgi:twinkle protein